ncbi:MAG: hypothetical protein ACOH1U_01145 [Rhodoglobus sp.]
MTTPPPAPDSPEQVALDRKFRKGLIRAGKRLDGVHWLFDADEDPGFPTTAAERRKEAKQTALSKGLLWHASVVMIDELFADIAALTLGDDPEDTMVLSELPPRFSSHYDTLFAQKFLVATVEVTTRLTSGWSQLASTAQELAFSLLLDRAEAARELFCIELEPRWTDLLFDCLLEDEDYKFLYDEVPVVLVPPPAEWFHPFNPGRRSAPYTEDPYATTA